MRFRRSQTAAIARERLQTMVENSSLECTSEQLDQMKKELSEIVGRYIQRDPEEYEIRVLVRQKQKRA